jgi:hypothetical protein
MIDFPLPAASPFTDPNGVVWLHDGTGWTRSLAPVAPPVVGVTTWVGLADTPVDMSAGPGAISVVNPAGTGLKLTKVINTGNW